MNRTLAIVVTYNRLDMLKQGLAALLSQTMPCDIMIVDNKSTDGTSAWAEELAERQAAKYQKGTAEFNIIYENTHANLGGAGGFNYGMKKACSLGYEFAWVMDDDAIAEPDCLEKLISCAGRLKATSRKFGFLSSIVLWTDGSVCKMNWQKKYNLPADKNEHHITDKDVSRSTAGGIIRIQSATFVSVLVPTDIIRKVGLPIKEFFIWCDDIEFTRRIAIAEDIPCYAVMDSRIVHHIKNNKGTNIATDDADRISRYNYAFRNENFMYRMYGIGSFFYYAGICVYSSFLVIKNARNHKFRRLWVIFKNFFAGLFFNPPIELP